MADVGPIWGRGPEPIAIVGIGCRFPGESSTPSKLWNLLKEGKSGHSKLPANRFDIDQWQHPDTNRPGTITDSGGYFLSHDESFRQFDPSFFGISPLEAATMDPQQRKFLEVVYEAFESAGATLEELNGSKTSCYVGCFTQDTANMNLRDFEYGAPYQMTGGGMTILSNRVNYVFNLKGPSFTIDTACSSSLYALHMACRSLVSGEVDAAVVGGSNLILGVEQHIATQRLGVFSPTSTCHTFDESADGFGRGDGICAFYIKKLSDALSNKDPIRAVIRSTAINTNGRSQGINHPSVTGQEAVIRAAYANAGLDYSSTPFFECHGTGTQVGDPIEVAAIGNVFAAGRTPENPLLLGSIKTNVGHTEGTSGLASVLKVVLCIENGMIPATVGVRKLNPAIDFRGGRLKVVQSRIPWPVGQLKRGSINSFGYGGANAHCIVESPEILLGNHFKRPPGQVYTHHSGDGINDIDTISGRAEMGQDDKKFLLVFSAHDQPTLHKNVLALATVADALSVIDLAHTLSYRRTKHRSQAFAIVSRTAIGSQLALENLSEVSHTKPEKPVVAFAFTGQGAQWPRMGYNLIQQYPVVRNIFDRLQAALDRLSTPPDWRLTEELSKPARSSRVQEAVLSQPLCIAVQVAISALLISWGIIPVAVVGHSSGEVAAAFAAGLLTAEEAVVVAYYRGLAHVDCHVPGAMMAVGLGAEEVSHYLEDEPDIVIACQNSPQSVTLSGGEEAIDKLRETLTADGLFARKINTSNNAYHSPRVHKAGQYYADRFGDSLPHLRDASRNCNAPMYSCITGEVLKTPGDVGIQYWRKNMEEQVRFTQALSNLVHAQPTVNCLLEIGPHSALAGPIRQIRSSLCLTADKLDYIPTVIRGEDAIENVLKTAGSLFCKGYPVDMSIVNADGGRKGQFLPDLPTYQWNYDADNLWMGSRLSHEIRYRKHPRHDLLGTRQLGNSDFSPEWRNRLKIKDLPWISDHQIGGDIIFPAAGYAAMAIEAVTQIAEIQNVRPQGYSFQRMFIKTPLILPSEGEVEVLFNLHPLDSASAHDRRIWFHFSISTVTADDKWVEHTFGKIALEKCNRGGAVDNLEVSGHRGAENQESSDRRWYSSMSRIGLHYGPSFRPLRDIRTTAKTDEAASYISLHPTQGIMLQESRYMIHPATLDGCLQLAVIASYKGEASETIKAYLPTVIDSLTVWQTPDSNVLTTEGIARSHGTRKGMRSAHGRTRLYSANGRELADVSVSLYSLEGGFGRTSGQRDRQPFSRHVWQPDIDRLDVEAFRRLWADRNIEGNDGNHSDHLHDLMELVVLNASALSSDIRKTKNVPMHISKYIDLLEKEAKSFSATSPARQLSYTMRQQRIHDLAEKLEGNLVEANLILRLSEKMPEILKDCISVVEVLLENDHLGTSLEHEMFRNTAHAQVTDILGLIAHKDPRIRILQIGSGARGATMALMATLQARSYILPSVQYTITAATDDGLRAAQDFLQDRDNVEFQVLDIESDPCSQGFKSQSYDVVLAIQGLDETSLAHCKSLLKAGGRLIVVESYENPLMMAYLLGPLPGYLTSEDHGDAQTAPVSDGSWNERLRNIGFSDVLINHIEGPGNTIVVASVSRDSRVAEIRLEKLLLVYHKEPHPLLRHIEKEAQKFGVETQAIALSDIPTQVQSGDRVLMLAELEEAPLLSNLNQTSLENVKQILQTPSSVVWVTNGGLLKGKRPQHSLILGMAKSIMAAQPSIRVSCVDVDLDEDSQDRLAALIFQHELALRQDHDRTTDTDIIVHSEIPHIGRFFSDPIENQEFVRQLQPIPQNLKLDHGLELAFQNVGQVNSFYFKESSTHTAKPQENEVVLAPVLYNLSKRDTAILQGTQDSETFSCICVAIVKESAAGGIKLQPGQQVVCLAPGNFDSSFNASEASCEVLRSEDKPENVVSSLLPYCTAMYGLSNLARMQSGHTALVHRASGPDQIAAVRFALLVGAKVIVTFESDEKQTLLHQHYPELAGCTSIILSSSLADRLSCDTDGKGVDVAVVSSGSPDFSEVWSSLAKNGRLICVKDAELPNFALLDPTVLARGASLMSLDLLDMIKHETEEVGKLVRKVILLMRDDLLLPIVPQAAFYISELPKAIATASEKNSFSSVNIRYMPDCVVPTHVPYKPVTFPSTASYLLVGCLGGLGRSLVMWMVARGARHFIFLSRSGADKPEAARLIKELEEIAATSRDDLTVAVVRGDVSIRADVDRAVAMAKTPIRGVMQHAMVLRDGFFGAMTLENWQTVLSPKVQGTINLHEALLSTNLDFFVMTSSTIGLAGAATQSNYAAANTFLDYMARHRHTLGLPASSLALGMVVEVGHVEAHPEILAALLRNGVYGIPEDEYLKMIEVACRPRRMAWQWNDDAAQAHIVTGMEPGLINSKAPFLHDNRFRHLAMAVSGSQGAGGMIDSGVNKTVAMLRTAAQASGEVAVLGAVQELVLERLSRFLLVPAEKLAESLGRALADFGMDSMLTAELRSWAWKDMKADLPFMALLEGSMSIKGLVDMVWQKMDHEMWRE